MVGGSRDAAARSLRLLSLLQARAWPGPELAFRLEVTTRTLRRDVDRLRRLGYPVEAISGPAGGYRLGRGGKLPPLLLDDGEALAATLGLLIVAGEGVAGLEDAALAALARLDQVLPAHLAARAEELRRSTEVLQRRPPDRVDPAALVTLARGCRRSERLRFDYRDRSGRASERLVEPYRLVRAGDRWYLVARDLGRAAWRSFRVDRLSRPVLVGRRFQPVDPPDAVRLVAAGMAVAPYAVRARLRLPVGLEEAIRIVPRTVGLATPEGAGSTVVELGAGSVAGLVSYLASLPVPGEVLDPPEVREALGRHAARLAAANGPIPPTSGTAPGPAEPSRPRAAAHDRPRPPARVGPEGVGPPPVPPTGATSSPPHRGGRSAARAARSAGPA